MRQRLHGQLQEGTENDLLVMTRGVSQILQNMDPTFAPGSCIVMETGSEILKHPRPQHGLCHALLPTPLTVIPAASESAGTGQTHDVVECPPQQNPSS